MQPPSASDRERFFEKVCFVATAKGCLEWTASKRAGYGRMGFHGRLVDAHRMSWMIHRGEIPVGMDVLHSCDNPACVNPEHLFLGTHADNMRDMTLKGRLKFNVGQRVHTAKLTPESVRRIKQLWLTSDMTQADLSTMFGVSRPMIGYIVRGEAWKSVDDAKSDKQTETKGSAGPSSGQ